MAGVRASLLVRRGRCVSATVPLRRYADSALAVERACDRPGPCLAPDTPRSHTTPAGLTSAWHWTRPAGPRPVPGACRLVSAVEYELDPFARARGRECSLPLDQRHHPGQQRLQLDAVLLDQLERGPGRRRAGEGGCDRELVEADEVEGKRHRSSGEPHLDIAAAAPAPRPGRNAIAASLPRSSSAQRRAPPKRTPSRRTHHSAAPPPRLARRPRDLRPRQTRARARAKRLEGFHEHLTTRSCTRHTFGP